MLIKTKCRKICVHKDVNVLTWSLFLIVSLVLHDKDIRHTHWKSTCNDSCIGWLFTDSQQVELQVTLAPWTRYLNLLPFSIRLSCIFLWIWMYSHYCDLRYLIFECVYLFIFHFSYSRYALKLLLTHRWTYEYGHMPTFLHVNRRALYLYN